ncbi:MAG: 2-iminobutanoate/2-iminopropanoate deaminase [Bacteroidota bacterium]|jgi:2-iminobutanoate/2-iminopropanoate deaminase
MTKNIIFSPDAPAAIGPYSQAVEINGTLYVSGQIALAAFEAGASIEEETEQVMKNMGHILTAAGYTYQNVVKCTIFVKDMGHFAQINAIYGSFFSDNFPARETVEVARLPKDVRVEISCIAYKS